MSTKFSRLMTQLDALTARYRKVQSEVEEKSHEVQKLKDLRVKEMELVRQKFSDQRKLFEAQRDELLTGHENLCFGLNDQIKVLQQKQKDAETKFQLVKKGLDAKIDALERLSAEQKEQIKSLQSSISMVKKIGKQELDEVKAAAAEALVKSTEAFEQRVKQMGEELTRSQNDSEIERILGDQQQQLDRLAKQVNARADAIRQMKKEEEQTRAELTELTRKTDAECRQMHEQVMDVHPQAELISELEAKLQRAETARKEAIEKEREAAKLHKHYTNKIEQLSSSQYALKRSLVVSGRKSVEASEVKEALGVMGLFQ